MQEHDQAASSALADAATMDLARGVRPQQVVARLVDRGLPEGRAVVLVESILQATQDNAGSRGTRLALRSKHSRHMLYGLLWIAGGAAVTAWSYLTAEPGGKYWVACGAIVYGIWGFLRGFQGWCKYRG